MTKVVGVDHLSPETIMQDLERGARFVTYQYVISLAVVSIRRSSPIYYIPPAESATLKGLPYVFLSLFLGWWGIPWGVIWTPAAIFTNLRGGKDITPSMRAVLQSALSGTSGYSGDAVSTAPASQNSDAVEDADAAPTPKAASLLSRLVVVLPLLAVALVAYSLSRGDWRSSGGTSAAPAAARSYVQSGDRFTVRADWDSAIASYSEAIRAQPQMLEAYWRRAEAFKRKGDPQHALADLDEAVRQAPQSADAYTRRARFHLDQKNLDGAISDFSRALTLKPNQPETLMARATLYFEMDDFEHAVADYDQVIRLKPTLAAAYSRRGVALALQGDLTRAMPDLDRAVALRPADALAHYGRALIYTQRKDWELAVAEFTEAIRLQPTPSGYIGRAQAYAATGDKARAQADFQHVVDFPGVDLATAEKARQMMRQAPDQ